ncbi:MAG TPA: hypothetical protein VLU43_16120, partial [Anaeromyxobacteraceae bacterium]|nr:hypothetical protein [Anaeromyxobacteraceae bacterium]
MATPDVGTLRRGRSAIGLSLIALVVGCNDHVTGKAGAGGSSAPFLADLSLLRSSAGLNEGGGATSVGFSVEVADPDADLAKLVVTVLDASDAEVGRFAYAVQNPPGVTGGLLAGDTAVPTTALGTYAVQLQAFDSGGRGSNVLEATFSVVPGNPLPSITSLDPSSAQAGSASFTLTVTGSDFLPSSSVLWDGYFLSTTYLDGSTLLASVPANDLYYTGMASITVLNPSPGGGVSSPATFAVTAPPAPVIATISPSSVTAGGPWFTLTVTGSGFAASSYVTWNGSSLATTFVDGSTLTATVPSYDTYYSGTAQITVYTSGAAASNAKTFTIDPQPPNPVPVLTGISPTSAYAGTSSVTVTLTGSGFVASSSAYWGGYSSLSTTFVDSSTLQATIPSYDLSGIGTGQISVSNPSPGGGTSGALKFSVTKPPQDGVTAVALQANDLVWDPYQRKIYAAVPSTSPVNPNTVTVVDPFTGQIEGSQFAGSEPRVLAVSDDGQFLYAGLGSASFVNRFALPALAQDLAIPLGRDPTLGAYSARDVQVAPGFPRTVAVSLGVGATPSVQGGVAIFDDATPRANRAASASNLFDSLQWG